MEFKVCIKCGWHNGSYMLHSPCEQLVYTLAELRDLAESNVEVAEFLKTFHTDPKTFNALTEYFNTALSGHDYQITPNPIGTAPAIPKGDGVTNDREAIQGNVFTPSKAKETRTTSSTGGQKGVKIERFDLIPIGPLTELAQHYGRGAQKYESHQWRQGYEWSKSYSALQRHLTAFWAGQDYDVCPFHLHSEPQHIQESLGGCAFNEKFPCEDGHRICYNHTGSHHMAAVAWHSFTLLEFKDRFPQHDDRYNPNGEK